jgi:TetR/AcrR family transcriptional repressor of nem operon
MSQRAEQKADTREAILRASAAILRERGIGGMSVERAMAGARRTVGGFYAHFSSKGELLAAAFDRAMDDIEQVMHAAARGRSGRDAVGDVAATYLSEEHRDRARDGCPLPAVAGGAAASAPRATRQLLARGVTALCERVSDTGGGELHPDRALALAAVMVGGQILARATRGTPLSSRVLEVSRGITRLLLRDGREALS